MPRDRNEFKTEPDPIVPEPSIPQKSSAPRGHFDRSLSEFTQFGENIFKESGDIARNFQKFQDEFRTFGADVTQSFTERGLEQNELDFTSRKKIGYQGQIARRKEREANELGTFDMLAGLGGMGLSFLMPQFSPQIQELLGNKREQSPSFQDPYSGDTFASNFGFLPYDFA